MTERVVSMGTLVFIRCTFYKFTDLMRSHFALRALSHDRIPFHRPMHVQLKRSTKLGIIVISSTILLTRPLGVILYDIDLSAHTLFAPHSDRFIASLTLSLSVCK